MTTKQITLVLTVVLISTCTFAHAARWSEPVLIPELNDPAINQQAYAPHLSADGLTMYFNRNIASSFRLWEAYRDTPDGPFVAERQITELYKGEKLYYPWVSADGLRMYYGRYEPSRGSYVLRVAKRDSADDIWQDVMGFYSIHQSGIANHGASLTADELTIFYHRGGYTPDRAIWTATRSSIDDQFSNPRPVTELNITSKCALSCISPDGLTIYYSVWENGVADIYMATRPSTDDPFSNIHPVKNINTAEYIEMAPYLTPDQQTMYFTRKGYGIFVSNWTLSPSEKAVLKISNAIAAKQKLIEGIDATIRLEVDAFRALSRVNLRTSPSQKRREILLAKISIINAIRKEIKAKGEIEKSIADLNQSLEHLANAAAPEDDSQLETDLIDTSPRSRRAPAKPRRIK